MPEFERFNGTGDPKAHLRHYVGLMRMSELEEDAIVQLFPLSLIGLASTWYYTLEENDTKEWGVLAEKFIQQFAYNTEMEVTKEELKETTQEDNETFSAFVKRWREKAAKMLKRPSDEEQNAIMLGCLNSRYYNAMYMIPTKVPFAQFYQQGLQIEEGIKSNKIIFNVPTPTTSSWRRNDYGVKRGNGGAGIGSSSEGHNGAFVVSSPKSKEVNLVVRSPQQQFTVLNDPMSKILERLVKKGLLAPLTPIQNPQPLPANHRHHQYCAFHQKTGHLTDECTRLRHEIQDLIDNGKIANPNEKTPNIHKNPLPKHDKPVHLILAGFNEKEGWVESVGEEKVESVSEEKVESLWGKLVSEHKEAVRENEQEKWSSENEWVVRVINIWESDSDDELIPVGERKFMISREFGETLEWGELEGEGEKRRDGESEDEEEEEEDVLHLTRSGRHYIPKHLIGEESETTEAATAKEVKKEGNLVVDQLKRTPANVNLWQLLMSSKEHRASLLRALAAVEVAEDTTPEQIVGMVKAYPGNDMSFEVLPPAMRNHNKPLLITVDILGNEISGAQVDDGSSINVCPVKMLEMLGFRRTDLKPSDFVVSGYDNQKRHALGTWRTKIKTGTVEVPIDFTVLDIAAPYPILLGRAWIHSVGAVPSTLHQKMIIPVEGGVETIFGEKSQKASVMLLKSEGDTLAWGNTRQVNMITYEEIEKKMGSGVAHMMKKSSYQPGQGLGVKNQGILEPIDPPTQNGTRGLGYDETLVVESGKTVYGVNRFVKPEAFTGQPEPWDFNGEILPGFEIFLDCPLQKVEPYCGEPEIFVVKGDPVPGFEILFKEKMRMDWEDWTRIQELKEQGARFIELSKTLKERSKLPEGVQDQEKTIESVSSSVGVESPGLRAEEFDESESNNDFVGDVGSLFDNFNELACDSAYTALPTLFDNCINTLNSEHANGPSLVQIDLELTVAVNIGTNDNPREIKIASDLEENERTELINTIIKYKECFAWSYEDMPGIDPEVAQHYIPTYPEAKPVKQKLRRMRPEWTLQIKEEVDKLLETKFIMPIQYPKWVSNIVVVPKKDGRVRMCVDYRDLNKACPKDDFPLPHIDVLVDQAAGYDRYSCVDGYSGYNQIMMAEEDREKTAFTVEWGTFCYRVMPFGLKNAGATYQRMATTVFHDMMHQTVEVYVDDMVIKSRGSGNHAKALEQFFDRILRFKLRLNPKKCVFGVRTCKLLGFKISQQGIVMDPDKAKAVLEMPEPKTEKEVRAFLGKIQYVSRFISKLTSVCKPIFKLLKKDQPVVWSEECRRAFQQIKECMMNPPVLVPPTPGKPLLLYLAVEEDVVAAMLAQEDDQGDERAVYYLSKKLLSYEERYSMVEKTCLALAWAAKKLHHYLQSYEAHVVSRMDPLKYLFETPPLVSRIARWMALIIQYDLKYITRKSVKGRGVADFLALKSNNEEEAVLEFPDEESRYVTTSRMWKMYFDGSSNKRGAGAGVIITTPEGEQLPIAMKLGFPATNNVVEYEACIHGLVSLLNLGAKEAEVYGDSSVVIFQSNREWVVKDERLREYQECVSQLVEKFDQVSFHQIPRTENIIADALSVLASNLSMYEDQLSQAVILTRCKHPAYAKMERVLCIRDGKPWYYDIQRYVETQEYPEGATKQDRGALRRLAKNYIVCGGKLYKKWHDGMHLLCVDNDEGRAIMEEIHAGVCGPHMNGRMLAKKIIRQGYFWTTMEGDCVIFALKCEKCQLHANLNHLPASDLSTMTTPWPFSAWGIDIIGQISPKSSKGHAYILVAIDYFTKWVEARPFKNMGAAEVAKFIKKNIICRYGVPFEMISDNGTHFHGEVTALLSEYNIKHHRSSPYRPQTNGAVEAANKNIKKMLAKMIKRKRDWAEQLPFALWGYRTTVRTSTGATPFALTYGMEAVLPIELQKESLRVVLESCLTEEDWERARKEELLLCDEKRLRALYHLQGYQRRLAGTFNKRIRSRKLKEGDLVLKARQPNEKDPYGKFKSNWTGPFVIKKILAGGGVYLMRENGIELANPTNLDRLKKFYA